VQLRAENLENFPATGRKLTQVSRSRQYHSVIRQFSYWLARCKLKTTLIVSRRVRVSVCTQI